jgi:hypothetical protein
MCNAACNSQHVRVEVKANDTPVTRLLRRKARHDTCATRDVEHAFANSHTGPINEVLGPERSNTRGDVALKQVCRTAFLLVLILRGLGVPPYRVVIATLSTTLQVGKASSAMMLAKPLSISTLTTHQNELRSRVDMTRSPKPSENDGYLRIFQSRRWTFQSRRWTL